MKLVDFLENNAKVRRNVLEKMFETIQKQGTMKQEWFFYLCRQVAGEEAIRTTGRDMDLSLWEMGLFDINFKITSGDPWGLKKMEDFYLRCVGEDNQKAFDSLVIQLLTNQVKGNAFDDPGLHEFPGRYGSPGRLFMRDMEEVCDTHVPSDWLQVFEVKAYQWGLSTDVLATMATMSPALPLRTRRRRMTEFDNGTTDQEPN